jgi:hypothetical protein
MQIEDDAVKFVDICVYITILIYFYRYDICICMYQATNGGSMKRATQWRVISVVGLLALAGARTAQAAEAIGDGQAQANEMILGRASARAPLVEASELRVAAARRDRAVASDQHEMARQMILGNAAAGETP